VALTVEEAKAVDAVLEFFLAPPDEPRPGHESPSSDRARAAAALLAEHANRRLMAGITRDDVQARWPVEPVF
jgi:hypothetical protein